MSYPPGPVDFVEYVRPSVKWDMAPADHMITSGMDHYRSVGASALRVIAAALSLSQCGEPASVLDFAAATGRVTRWLRAAFPTAELHVSDVHEEWVVWSAAAFGATGWLSSEELTTVVAPRQYDLIWCGSLITHLSLSRALQLLRKFDDWLTPNGVCVVTTHGRRTLQYMLTREHEYFPRTDGAYNQAAVDDILAQLRMYGYGFVSNPGDSWGISVNSVEWLVRAANEIGARIVAISEHAWDNHQDVIAFQKPALPLASQA